ncbi:SH3 domain-containing protein [Arthrobacter sp. JSM 101049]|uniref:SH3 domain-containing protein n=1 Tax=Arthrobacter sp. JSM 101049 TaxID=929097 RepID=UPI003566FEF5
MSTRNHLFTQGAVASVALALVTAGGAPPAAAAPSVTAAFRPVASPIASTVALQALPAAKTVKYAKTTANLNLRRNAGTKYPSLGVMKKGTVVARTGRTSGAWWQVRYGSKTGWASSDYLRSTAKPAAAKPQPGAAKAIRWFAGSQALYAKPTFASKRLQAFTKGIKATQLRTSGSWSYVQAPGSRGWVPTRDLSKKATRYTGSTILPSSSHRWTRYASHVRTGGSTSTRSLGVVPAGEMMPVLSGRNGWSRVKTSKGTGWIKNTLLTNLATKAPPHLQPVTARMIKKVKARYGRTYSSVGTLRNGSIGHRLGVGSDFMMRGWSASSGIRNGNNLAAYLVRNRASLDIDYIIWRDRIWLRQDGQWGPYSKGGWGRHLNARGWNATTMHYDHVHVENLVD